IRAHQELRTEQQVLGAGFAAARGHEDRAALRGSLAALTERATRTVAVAVAASGTASDRTPPPGEPGSTSNQEAGVQSSAGGTPPLPPREPVRWKIASAPDRGLAPVAVALDAPDIDVAAHWATLVTPYVSTVKIGLELYLRYGPTMVAT